MNPRLMRQEGNRLYVNSSSLSVIQSCLKKADYILNHGLVAPESTAASFGTRIHKAMEDFYSKPAGRRPSLVDLVRSAMEGFIPTDDRRTVETALKMAEHYEESFKNDPWVVMRDLDEKPLVEREFSFLIQALPQIEVYWFGKIDLAVANPETGELAVMDHKTTSSVGRDFMARWNPNHQLTGYMLGVQSILNEPCNKAIINGLQVVKTKQNVVRLETTRTQQDFDDFRKTVMFYVTEFYKAKKMDFYPKAGGYTCGEFGGCSFIDSCQGLLPANKITPKENLDG